MIPAITELLPVVLAVTLPVVVLGALVLYLLRGRSLTAAMITLGVVPLAAALLGVVVVDGFMYTPQLARTVVVVVGAAVVTVPSAFVLGRGFARRAAWQHELRQREREAESARRDLVSSMSHDLRSPLAGIRGLTDALADGIVHDPVEVGEYLGRIRRETERMTTMVEDLFELSRATSPHLSLTLVPLALGEIVSDAVAAEAPAAAAGDVRLAAVDPERWELVRGSEIELTRVVRNLLANAIRHTVPGGEVRLTSGITGERVWLSVQDACGGIPAGDLGRVFEVGFRGSTARTPGSAGAGLGLAIARGLLDAHGGSIEIANVGPGCRVTVWVPRPGTGQTAAGASDRTWSSATSSAASR